MSDTWTIGELAERAADLLGQDRRAHGQEPRDDGPESRVNGRIREVPNERLIRWYTTIGLLDPPLGRRGRVALYGRRHLLQLVAVKRRQADGLSIAAIQAELAGATDAMLQRAAGLTEPPPKPPPGPAPRPLVPPHPRSPAAPATANAANHLPDAPGTATPPSPGWCGTRPETGTAPAVPDVARPAARDRFWARPASVAATADPGHFSTANSDTTHDDITQNVAPVNTVVPDVVHGVRLAPGVTVLLDPAHRVPDGHEVAALRRAAAPLLTALAMLGLAGPFDGAHDTHDDSALDPHASDPLEG
ncbi:MerR family transcriptional regulator [Microbispora sp. NBRC 16548]|uniref:MerR family transcriptional regulator n=1 Tax=Microbispora sp. NBRC 16548 TaxID=3030994 RepID=UPI0024A16CE7|nr:MerR family transcriptional regulator [Microbispora sp. NBRC 16548]GLX05972.1 hypothetical protein Misp03_28990 [Microbispora sp. NBRC 16548]